MDLLSLVYCLTLSSANTLHNCTATERERETFHPGQPPMNTGRQGCASGIVVSSSSIIFLLSGQIIFFLFDFKIRNGEEEGEEEESGRGSGGGNRQVFFGISQVEIVFGISNLY